jgi:DNA repair exonuclease SbcCD ATPase subunit
MIKKLVIKNFQSHKKTSLSFNKGLNVIVGLSNTGKTSLKRAIEWAVFNKPDGKKFKEEVISSFCDPKKENTSCLLIFDNCKIKRIRNNSNVNYYKVNGRKLSAIGRSVPEEVQHLINMNEINFQNHTEPFFLLSKTETEVAKYLNKITDLEIIDDSISNIRKEKFYTQNKLNEIERELQRTKEQLESYAWVEKAEERLKELIEEKNIIQKQKKLINEMFQLKNKLISLSKEKEKFKFNPDIKNKLAGLEKTQKEIENIRVKNKVMEVLFTSLKDKVKEAQKLKKNIKEKQSEFNQQMPDICPLCEQKISS